jgi:Asp-tRNA(Asn)/Glu-tRNA(Gln) amidotransferase A subunit family amidase
MPEAELCYMSATEALAAFKARKLSPVELMGALIARAEAVEPKINAFPMRHFEQALDQAKKAEARYMKTDGRLRPLEGIACAIKDETTIKGWRSTFGSLLFKDNIDSETAPPAERILKAGAIVHARSAAPEFSCAPYTHSRLWGITRTPWNLDYSCGGSSGGAGASLAAGSTTLANGSDIGGSIRIPASMCGVVGFKPPYGRNPEAAPYNLDHYSHTGPLARTVADCALLQNVMSGPHPRDIVSIRPKLRIPTRLEGDLKGWRVAFSPALDGYEIEPDVARNTAAAAEAFRALGATVEEVELGWDMAEIRRAAAAHYGIIFGPWIKRVAAGRHDELTAYARAFADRAGGTTGEHYLESLFIEGRMYARLGKILQRYRLLICPTLPVPAVKAGADFVDEPLMINGKPHRDIEDWLMTICFNIMSRCPVMSVPSGFAANGVPTGLSIVGRTFDDVSVFRAAAAFERARPWLDAPERRPRLS